jgi:DNA-binding transcriptional MerR regulator/methylmalonyl-CoA mutase cobalamin-binding subunit
MSKNEFSIRQVVELTGVSEYVLRAWELRYGAFKPRRTETGRRLYSRSDLQKASALSELTQKGIKISEIASLDFTQLSNRLSHQKLKTEIEAHATPPIVQEILNSAQKFVWEQCRKTLLTQRKKLKTPQYIHQLILPLTQAIGLLVVNDDLSIAQEHILSSFIKENLSALEADRLPTHSSKRVVLACPEGDIHEIGLLVALALIRNAGLTTLYLGPNTPTRALCESAIRFRATHVLISSTIAQNEGAKEDFLQTLHFLDQQLPKKIKFWLGGRNIASSNFSLSRSHKKIKNFEQLETIVGAPRS